MEFKEIIKILKSNLVIIFSFVVIGGGVAAVFIVSRPVLFQGDFTIYLNEMPSEKGLQNYNEFYALESLGQVSDLLVEWSKSGDFENGEIPVQLKKKTTIYLEGAISAGDETKIKNSFSNIVAKITAKINELNGGIFLNNKIVVSFSDFNVSKIEINFWRYFGAGIFGGLVIGVFAAFAKFYFKEEK